MAENFTIEVRSTYAELWRYNISIICGGFDSTGERVAFLSEQSIIASVGANLTAAPKDYDRHRELSLTIGECHSIVAYVYVVPHTLPLSRDIDDYRPFDLKVKVSCGERIIHSATHHINQWGGESIELKFNIQNS